jgi:hypothetical protein
MSGGACCEALLDLLVCGEAAAGRGDAGETELRSGAMMPILTDRNYNRSSEEI